MGEKLSNNISSESMHHIYSKTCCILLGTVSAKVVQIIVKFQILDFSQIFIVFANVGPYGSKSFKRHLL